MYDFKDIIEGDTFLGAEFELKDGAGAAIDLTDFEIRMHVRRKPSASSDLEMAFTTADGTIVIDAPPTDGKFNIPGRRIDIPPYGYVYDMEFTSPAGVVRTWLSGKFPVVEAVTH